MREAERQALGLSAVVVVATDRELVLNSIMSTRAGQHGELAAHLPKAEEYYKKAYETFPDIDFIARTPLIPGVNADEEHIRSVLAFIRPTLVLTVIATPVLVAVMWWQDWPSGLTAVVTLEAWPVLALQRARAAGVADGGHIGFLVLCYAGALAITVAAMSAHSSRISTKARAPCRQAKNSQVQSALSASCRM